MSDIIQQLENYQAHFDRAISRDAPSQSHVIEPNEEGGVVVVEVTANASGTDEANGARRLWQLAAYAAAAVVLVVGILAVVNRGDETVVTEPASSSDGTAASAGSVQDPAVAVIEEYFAAYNSGDIEAMMAFFDENSVIVDHPVMGSTPAEGAEWIESLMRTSISLSAETDAYSISNIVVSGSTVTWDDEWTNSQGHRYCSFGNSALVEDGTIVRWTIPPSDVCT